MEQVNINDPGNERIDDDLERIERGERRLAEDVERLKHDEEGRKGEVDFFVNNSPVHLADRNSTGLGIKEAAIAQGVAIQLDFQLWRLESAHKRVQVANDEPITVHDHERFAANAPDDNA
jgi:hypothetical protein